MDTVLGPVKVICVTAKEGTEGARRAFASLESKLPTLRKRKFYGTYDPFTGEYRACVEAIQGEDPQELGLESWTIPGGRYAKQRVPEWKGRVKELPQMFDTLVRGRRVDRSRPSVEFCRSERELIIFLPILE